MARVTKIQSKYFTLANHIKSHGVDFVVNLDKRQKSRRSKSPNKQSKQTTPVNNVVKFFTSMDYRTSSINFSRDLQRILNQRNPNQSLIISSIQSETQAGGAAEVDKTEKRNLSVGKQRRDDSDR